MKIVQILIAVLCIAAARKIDHRNLFGTVGRVDNYDDASYSNMNQI